MQSYNLSLGYQTKVVGLMNNHIICVANLGVPNLSRMNNPSPSDKIMTNLRPSSVDAPLPIPPAGHTSDHGKNPYQDDCNLLGESWITDNPLTHLLGGGGLLEYK